jgi:SWI/SNF-related matrix-associated actin-dependent regulator of chromatin subfamily A3
MRSCAHARIAALPKRRRAFKTPQVGHLRRQLVCHIAPLIDSGALAVEGLAAGRKGGYELPVRLLCFGPPDSRAALAAALRRAGTDLEAGGGPELTPPSGGGAGGSSGGGGAPAWGLPLSKREVDDSLERLFDDLAAGGGAPRESMAPAPEITTPLLPHQRIALAWMVRRENSGALPPFWEAQPAPGGALAYLNTLTNFSSPTRPEPVRGGARAARRPLAAAFRRRPSRCQEAAALRGLTQSLIPPPHTAQIGRHPGG